MLSRARFPQLSVQFSVSQKLQRLQEKPIVTSLSDVCSLSRLTTMLNAKKLKIPAYSRVEFWRTLNAIPYIFILSHSPYSSFSILLIFNSFHFPYSKASFLHIYILLILQNPYFPYCIFPYTLYFILRVTLLVFHVASKVKQTLKRKLYFRTS